MHALEEERLAYSSKGKITYELQEALTGVSLD